VFSRFRHTTSARKWRLIGVEGGLRGDAFGRFSCCVEAHFGFLVDSAIQHRVEKIRERR
jgi:hypothetical protein